MPHNLPTLRVPMVPKLMTMLAEGYRLDDLRKDAVAGLTVAIVALPLSMAIAVACGVGPERGLYTAIIGGFLVSVLGGSRFQIGGPAGAFIVLVASTFAKFGLEGLLLTVFLSGILLFIAGLLRFGDLIRRIPHAVTVGFTAGIAVVILASQLKDLFGLHLSGPEPGRIIPKIMTLAAAFGTFGPASFMLSTGVAATIFTLRRFTPSWPGMLIAVVAASSAAWALHLPVDTIASRFGGVPRMLPSPHLPDMDLGKILPLIPAVLSFTLLGSIESLLSAVVADRMTDRRHRPNMELVAQGVANMGSALFGGLAVTGTIARTATNVRAGARSPVAGILHSIFLLAFMVIVGPLAGYIPVSALAGVLLVVSWNMIERREFAQMFRHWRPALVLLATFGVTVAEDLTMGILSGCGLSLMFWGWDRPRGRARKA